MFERSTLKDICLGLAHALSVPSPRYFRGMSTKERSTLQALPKAGVEHGSRRFKWNVMIVFLE